RVRLQAKVKQAKIDMANIVAAIKQYEATYERFPSTKAIEQLAAADPTGDHTFLDDNHEIMEILLAAPRGANLNNTRNPRQLKLLDAKLGSGKPLGAISNNDYIFRDPWGNAYNITIDYNGDGKCVDKVYGEPGVSG